jgi:RhoGAP domain
VIQALKEKFNNGNTPEFCLKLDYTVLLKGLSLIIILQSDMDVDLLNCNEYYDIHAVAGLLKLFLRELPTPILTQTFQKDFLHVTDLIDRNDRITEISRLVARLPLTNYTLLRALVAHLIRVVQHCSVNKMTVRNISIVFSPTLNIPAGVFMLMLAEYGIVFCGETLEENGLVVASQDDGDDQQAIEESDTTKPQSTTDAADTKRVRHRNSTQYEDKYDSFRL